MLTARDLEQTLQRSIAEHGVPGASFAMLDGDVIVEAAAGLLNTKTRVEATPDSSFQIGSITKPMTASLVMQLADAGKLELDEPVRKWLPSFTVLDAKAAEAVTPRQLLCHTSGIEGDLWLNEGGGDDSLQQLLNRGVLLPSLFSPGETMSYCNFGYAVLGRLIEVASHRTWDGAMHEGLAAPLGFEHAFTRPEHAIKFRCAVGHVTDPSGNAPTRVVEEPYLSLGNKAAGATQTMSARDVVKFARLHIERGMCNGAPLIDAKSVDAMHAPHVQLPAHMEHDAHAWGLGFSLMSWSGLSVIGHDGGTCGQYSFMRIVPSKRVAVVLLTNGGRAGRVYRDMMERVCAESLGVPLPRVPDATADAPRELGNYVGRYESMSGGAELRMAAGGLEVGQYRRGATGARHTVPITWIDATAFRTNTGNAGQDGRVMVFQDFVAGRPTYLNVDLRLLKRT